MSFYPLRASQYILNNSNSCNNNHYKRTYNNNINADQEEHLSDNCEIDREELLTDDNAYSEYFRDDFNKEDDSLRG